MPCLQVRPSLPPSLLNLVLQFPSMASSETLICSLFLLSLISHTFSQHPTPTPTALVLPISKHPSALQYTTTLTQSTPPSPLTLVIDLSGPFLWLSCGTTHHSSSTSKPVQCHSPHCSLLPHSNKNCHKNKTCILLSKNKFTQKVSAGELSEDILSVQSTNGLYPTSIVSVPRFPFLCLAQESLSLGLATGAKGVAGLGHDRLGLPAQLADAFNFSRKFAMCLSPSADAATGVLFFGDGPYAFSPGIDVSKLLIFTPLIHKSSTYSFEYFIKVKSVRVDGKNLPLNSTLLTMISTVHPYGILESSVYEHLARGFIEAANATRVAPVSPFNVCFSTQSENGGLTRPAMPVLDFVLRKEKVFWRIFESNSMVPVGNDTTCLGFLDGGPNPGASIIIGGHQLEDNLLQFDLVSSRLGFTSSLFLRQTDCASFNWH